MEASIENAAGPAESIESVQGHDSGSEHQGLESQNRNAPQPEINPFMQQFMEMMQRMAPSPQSQLHDVVIDKNYEIVRRQGVKVFAGTTNPAEAEEWLRNTERVLDRIECTSEQKLRYAVSLLEKDALDWWETVPGNRNRPATLTWNDFLKEFADRKKVEFLELKQNELSVAEYELQFVRLSKYAPEEVSTDELRIDRFERGLRFEIREKIAIKPLSYGALLEVALRAEETSIERSSTEAKRKKLTGNLNPTVGQSGAFSFRGSGPQRGWFRGRGVGQTSRSSSLDLEQDRVQPDRLVEDLFPLVLTVVGDTLVNVREFNQLYVIVVINHDTLSGTVLHGGIIPEDLRLQSLAIWGKTHNGQVRAEDEVEVVEDKVVSLNHKPGCMQSQKNKLLRHLRLSLAPSLFAILVHMC
ncbi:UNVERIFIED_CONTAM: hypothetical protein Sindi_0100500, partial [Sesamum indicum]